MSRSAGKSINISRGLLKSSHSLAGELESPGRRHAEPIIAIGSFMMCIVVVDDVKRRKCTDEAFAILPVENLHDIAAVHICGKVCQEFDFYERQLKHR